MTAPARLYFVFLGESLPHYGSASLEFALRNSGLEIHLIGNASLQKSLPSKTFGFTSVEDFYDGDQFTDALKKMTSNHAFRDGLFSKSLERFFILEQYMREANAHRILHAELDQLLFRTDYLLEGLDRREERGIFLPFHNQIAAVGSLFYCNSQESFKSLLSFSCKGDMFPHEMALIASWASQNSDRAFALPTLASQVMRSDKVSNESIKILSASELGGIVDAAQIGQWIAGIDPRNVPVNQSPRTKFVDQADPMLLSRKQLRLAKFNFNSTDRILACSFGNDFKVNVYNLHIHSKIHKKLLKSDPLLAKTLTLANQDKSTLLPGVRKRQIIAYFCSLLVYIKNNPKKVFSGIANRIKRFCRSHKK